MPRLTPLGITVRLGIGFALVAILAVAGNFLVTQEVSGVGAGQGFRSGALPQFPTAAPLAADAPPPAEDRANPQIVIQLIAGAARVESLLVWVEKFEHAANARAQLDAPSATEQFQFADAGLTRAAAIAMPSQGTAAFLGGDAQLAAALVLYQEDGRRFVQLSDLRRATVRDYSATLDAISLDLTESLDRAWKLFGRVFERRTLMQMHEAADDLGRSFDGVRSSDDHDAGAAGSLLDSETFFAQTLARTERSLARSEGSRWIRKVHEQFARLVDLRRQLFALDGQRLVQVGVFSADGSRFTSAILARWLPRLTLVSDAPTAAARILAAAGAAPIAAPTGGTASIGSAVSAGPAPPAAAPPATARVADARVHGRALVGWTTVGVLLALLIVSGFTVRSVVGPVHRMLAVMTRLEHGDPDARACRGGLRELDTLAVAFNRMADQFAIARQVTIGYQQQLEAKVAERTRQLQQLADHDPLTQLPNRRQLFTLLTAAIDRAAHDRLCVGAFFLDVDNFKNLNDSMGHAFGDRVLINVAQRLSELAKPFGFAARLGGDEFTVVCEQAATVDAVLETGRDLVTAFRRPLVIDEREVAVSVSVGAGVFPIHGRNAEDLLSAADAALFRAKALGRRQLAVFTPELLATAATKYATEQGLRRAIEYGEFELHYQPETSIGTAQVVLVEALIRWRQPGGRLAPPGEFLTVADEAGLMGDISDWVLSTAIAAASYWHHGDWPDACVAINLAPSQLLDPHFVSGLVSRLQEFRLPARCIELELTESVLQTGPATIETLHQLRSHGIAVALDDFGTGYSSITSLEQLPLTRVKLDRSLIASIDSSTRSAAIARAIIGLCNGLGLGVTAEGVERHAQLAMLSCNRSMDLQGYLLSPPVPRHEILNVRSTMARHVSELLASPAGLDPVDAVPRRPHMVLVKAGG